jgi:hypothetical protein
MGSIYCCCEGASTFLPFHSRTSLPSWCHCGPVPHLGFPITGAGDKLPGGSFLTPGPSRPSSLCPWDSGNFYAWLCLSSGAGPHYFLTWLWETALKMVTDPCPVLHTLCGCLSEYVTPYRCCPHLWLLALREHLPHCVERFLSVHRGGFSPMKPQPAHLVHSRP